MVEIIFIVMIGLASGFLGATVGGGGLISIPALLFLGFPPPVVIATNNVGDLGAFFIAIWKYYKAKKIQWRISILMCLVAIIGSVIGSQIFLQLPPEVLKKIIGVALLLFLPVVLLKRRQTTEQNPHRLYQIGGLLMYVLLTVVSAITGGAGHATIYLLLLMYCFSLPMTKAYATLTIPEFCGMLVLTGIYAWHGLINFQLGAMLLISNLAGGWLGTTVALGQHTRWLRWLLVSVMALSGINILLFGQ